MADARRLPTVSLQLAGPAARPKEHPDFALVAPLLAMGEYPTADDAAWLRHGLDVRVVVSLQDDVDLQRKGLCAASLAQALATHDLVWHRHPVGDGDLVAMAGALDPVVRCLDRHIAAGERVHLHCDAGFNRAPTAAIAYLHRHAGLTLDAACATVKSVRPGVPCMQLLRSRRT